MGRWIAVAPFVVVISTPGAARSAPCDRAEEGPTVVLQSIAWRTAVAALREATGDRDQPWGCSGGTIDLVEHDGRATLMVRGADGVMVTREVDSPEDVVPLGEALLARPEPARPPVVEKPAEPVAVKAPKASDTATEGPPAASPRIDPRVIASAVVAPRYAGRADLVLGGVTAAVGLPLSSWVPALFFRFDGTLGSLEEHDAPLMEFCAGGAFGRSFPVKALEIRASVNGSAAVIVRPDRPGESGETHVDGRVGAEARFAFPRTSLVRAVVTTDTELAPGEFGGGRRRDPMRPPPVDFPSYTLGLGIGVEIAPR